MGNDHWIDDADHWICPRCGFITSSPSKYEGCKCPRCSFQAEKDKIENEVENAIGSGVPLPEGHSRKFEKIMVEALEQEPILDKIRAEIEQNAYPIVHGVNNHEKGMTLYGILQVIDKYKAESE